MFRIKIFENMYGMMTEKGFDTQREGEGLSRGGERQGLHHTTHGR